MAMVLQQQLRPTDTAEDKEGFGVVAVLCFGDHQLR